MFTNYLCLNPSSIKAITRSNIATYIKLKKPINWRKSTESIKSARSIPRRIFISIKVKKEKRKMDKSIKKKSMGESVKVLICVFLNGSTKRIKKTSAARDTMAIRK